MCSMEEKRASELLEGSIEKKNSTSEKKERKQGNWVLVSLG